MRKLVCILTILIFTIACKAQQVYDIYSLDQSVTDGRYYKDLNGNLDPFIGVWKNVTGNKTFKVTLWKKEKDNVLNDYYIDAIVGDYEMIENEGQPNETILYKSKKDIFGNGSFTGTLIYLKGNYPWLSGFTFDDVHLSASTYSMIHLPLSFKIDPATGKAHWQAKDKRHIRLGGDFDVEIPLDVILTKQ